MRAFVMAAAIAVVSTGQGVADTAAGSWIGQFNGRTFVRLELRVEGDRLAGSLSIGNIQVDKAGALERVDEAPAQAAPLLDVTRKGSTVSFARKDVDDTDRFELHVTDASHAELHLVVTDELRKELADAGIPPPKPIALIRPR